MEYKKPVSDNNSDIIMIDNPLETITINESSPEKRKRIKKRKPKKQRKRKVQLGVDHNNDMETLLITQKLQVKRKKFHCIINIDTVCKKSKRASDSIIRFSKNDCNISASYERIVPICLRNNCFHINKMSQTSCCKLEKKKGKQASRRKRHKIYTPIPSVALTENEINISYEDVSNGDFPDLSSEDELDTLIKRTKEREKQSIDTLKTTLPLDTSSPLHTNEDIASTYSSASIHSKATFVLTPEIEAYSPKGSPNYMQDAKSCPIVTPESIEKEEHGKGEYVDQYSSTDQTVTPPRFDFIAAFDQDCTRKNYSWAIPPSVKSERDNDNKNDTPDFVKNVKDEIKTEIVEITDRKSSINTEEIFVKRENGSDVNANFEVYIKTERHY